MDAALIPLRDKHTPEQQATVLTVLAQRDARARYEASCKNKLAFDAEEEAAVAAVEVQHKDGEPMSAYKCRDCDGWHIGHTPKGAAPSRFPAWDDEPASVEAARIERRGLVADVMDIDSQLTMLNEQRPDFWQARRQKAIRAKRYKQRRLLFLSDWLKGHVVAPDGSIVDRDRADAHFAATVAHHRQKEHLFGLYGQPITGPLRAMAKRVGAYEAVWYALLEWIDNRDDTQAWDELVERVERARELCGETVE